MKQWIAKNDWWLHWLVKILIPLALFLGMIFGSYVISYFGLLTKSEASQLYVSKEKTKTDSIAQEQMNDRFKRVCIALNIKDDNMDVRQQVNRRAIVRLNRKLGFDTEDYPPDKSIPQQ
jgi:hypothetical protein